MFAQRMKQFCMQRYALRERLRFHERVVFVLMCLMFAIIFFKNIMQRTNTKGFEAKQLLGEHITCTTLGSFIYAYNYKRTVVDKWRKLL
jgi:hypothetical protein